ncbi:hypothetical protein SAMN06298216_0521 [Spirosomataceae bacterium TFI 002]|nr:hypothetical protein SAMN06298216_0521 [Spirosomataceae bacterium TFI 002]
MVILWLKRLQTKLMKHLLLFVFFITIYTSCSLGDYIQPESKELKSIVISNEHAQVMMSKELYHFYNTSDKSFEFYEIYWKNRYLINYKPLKETLHISMDICSGWIPIYYVGISEMMLEKLSNSGLLFEQYDELLEKAPPGKSEVVKTNGCMGYYGK